MLGTVTRAAVMAAGLLILASAHTETFAASDRNCTAAEKKRADKRLDQIGGDSTLRNKLIRWHLRFGTHQTVHPADSEEILVQGGYVMNHDKALRTSLWAAYRLTAKNMIDAEGKQRVNCFRQDPRRGSFYTAVPSDYDEPRYDQGH
ncbi:MAG TPA: DNA/RNA non-specific endonuclease, partial [Candidatus Acidoferrales bacterium]|nr:DNA/RNA non-specific endonuclease [Candidatus Acidoferrales bacterium]